MVDGYGEEPVHLGRVQGHGQHPGGSRSRQHVRNQAGADRDPWSILLVRPRVPEVRDHRRDVRRGCTPGGVQHQQQLEEVLLDGRDQRLDDVDVPLPAVGPQLHLQAVVAEPGGPRVVELDAEDLAHLLGELMMRGPGKDGDFAGHGRQATSNRRRRRLGWTEG